MRKKWVLKTYRRYAQVYDVVFGTTLSPGRQQLLRRIRLSPNDRILEIGVGTGLTLPRYPSSVRVTGIDLSAPMLAVARRRVRRHGLMNVSLHRTDAENTSFPSASFDVTVAMYVVSVTPNPGALVREMYRLTKPGGRMYILNHFSREGSWTHTMDRFFAPLAPYVGFEPLFPLDRLLAQMDWEGRIVDHPVRPFGYWRILECFLPPKSPS